MDQRIDFEREDCAALEAFLVERIYEFNARATGCDDGRLLAAAMRDDRGEIVAAISGHTWAGCCQVTHLWVDESRRGRGLGRALLSAAEAEARGRGCAIVIVASHSFQAPGFYERLGYARQAAVADHPPGHANIVLAKRL